MRLRDKVIIRSSIGFGLGVLIGVVICEITSTEYAADGWLLLCTPAYLDHIGNEVVAFVIQCVLCGLYGALGMGGAVVYDIENWSILRATLTHSCAVVCAFYAMAFYLRWIEVTDIAGIAILALFFVIPYVIIWLVNYLISSTPARRRVRYT